MQMKTLIVIHISRDTPNLLPEIWFLICRLHDSHWDYLRATQTIRCRYEMNFTDTDFMTMTRARYGNLFPYTENLLRIKGFHLAEKSFEANLVLKNSKANTINWQN